MKNKKPIITILLSLLLLTCLCACSSNASNKEKNEVAPLFEQGYEMTQTTLIDYTFKGLFMKDNDYNDAYKVICKMDEETYDKLLQCDTFEEDGLKQFVEIVTYLPDCTVTSMEHELPKDGELEEYIGKTVKDVENDGYERSGYYLDEEGCIFYADGPKYSITIQAEEVIKPEEIDNYSENDLRQLTVKSIEFDGFSYRVLD